MSGKPDRDRKFHRGGDGPHVDERAVSQNGSHSELGSARHRASVR
jgi:hypothetical protein